MPASPTASPLSAAVARIAAEGHLLANHSAEHVFLGSSYDSDPAKLLHQLLDLILQAFAQV